MTELTPAERHRLATGLMGARLTTNDEGIGYYVNDNDHLHVWWVRVSDWLPDRDWTLTGMVIEELAKRKAPIVIWLANGRVALDQRKGLGVIDSLCYALCQVALAWLDSQKEVT